MAAPMLPATDSQARLRRFRRVAISIVSAKYTVSASTPARPDITSNLVTASTSSGSASRTDVQL